MPVSDISSVRGIGVADIVSTSTAVRSDFRYSLCSTPKRCSSSTMTRPEVLEPDGLLQQPVRADDDVDAAVDDARQRSPRPRRRAVNRDSSRIVTGNCAIRSAKVWMCWWASSVVGTRTATCLPSCTALNAARTATSVLP